MYNALTPGAERALARAEARALARGGAAVEPSDLLAALADEAAGGVVLALVCHQMVHA